MKGTKRIATAACAALALTMAAGTTTAFAAETQLTTEPTSYSYPAGQQRSSSRNAIYAQAEEIEDEAEREAFLKENGIADTEYSEEAVASYSYVGGRDRGASYRTATDDELTEAQSGYAFIAGQQRGASYHH